MNTCAVTHAHVHTHQGLAVEKRVTMAECGNWLWTAASAKVLVLSEKCQDSGSFTIIFLYRTAQYEEPGLEHYPTTTNNTFVSVEAKETTCLSLMRILDCMLSWIRNRKSNFRSMTAVSEKDFRRHWHSKKLINTDCLSNSNIWAGRAFHLKSNVAAPDVMQYRGIFHLLITCTVSKPIRFLLFSS